MISVTRTGKHLIFGSILALTGCAGGDDDGHTDTSSTKEGAEMDEAGHGDGHDDGHGGAEEYEGLTSPLTPSDEVIAEGAELYGTYCASCHGAEGKGDGEAAADLMPAASDLTDGHVQDATDGYLFYRITEGGMLEPFNSAMPAFEEQMTEDERWHVVEFIRSLGGEGHADDDHADGDHADEGPVDAGHADGDHADEGPVDAGHADDDHSH